MTHRRRPVATDEDLPARESNGARPQESAQDQAGGQSEGGGFPWVWVAAALVLVLIVAAIALGPRTLRRRRRDQRGLLGPEEAWAELRDTALDLRLPWPRSRSPWQTREALVQLFGAPRDEFTPERPRRGPDTNHGRRLRARPDRALARAAPLRPRRRQRGRHLARRDADLRRGALRRRPQARPTYRRLVATLGVQPSGRSTPPTRRRTRRVRHGRTRRRPRRVMVGSLGLLSWHRVREGPGLSPRGCGGASRAIAAAPIA